SIYIEQKLNSYEIRFPQRGCLKNVRKKTKVRNKETKQNLGFGESFLSANQAGMASFPTLNFKYMKHIEEPEEGTLTTKMDVGTKGFDDFQAILFNKSKQRTENQKRRIELLSFRYEMEDYVNSETNDFRPVGD